MSLIIPANTLASGGFAIDNSCRFNDGSSDYLSRTQGTPSSDKIGTYSTWFKISTLGTDRRLRMNFVNGDDYGYLRIHSDNTLQFYAVGGGSVVSSLITNQLFRDVSAWYHVVLAIDTTQGTASNRVKIYVNGTQVTSFSTETYFGVNVVNAMFSASGSNQSVVGGAENGTVTWDGYLAETVFIDGQQLDPTSFGEFDEDSGIWKPIDVSGLTFGTNGFYLDFEDSAALGDDVSGNGNDFTVNNLTAIDQSTDTCTNNYCTLNPLDPTADITLSEGNLKGVYGTSGTRDIQGSTFGVSSGKWYWEIKIGGAESPNNAVVGVTQLSTDNEIVLGGATDNSWGYRGYDGEVFHNNSSVASYATFDGTSIIGIYLDLDNHKLYLSKDGALQSATGISLDTAQDYFPAISDAGSTATPSCEMNFGSPSFSISSGNTDANGYGNFEYSATITGDGASKNFLALNTKNLSEVLG
jgi:hypothetical protein